jgi:MSHA biogenesis protein MshL
VRASDIHIEPQEKKLLIRFRIDGVLHLQTEADPKIATALVLRVKLMSGLDISEKRLPQDGRFNVKIYNTMVDVRISTMPTQFGESVVMRLLNQASGILTLDKLGMPPHILERMQAVLRRPSGMLLVTGPTGSGKTTTLYAALAELNTPERKIITVEDPVEYRLPGINQVQVHDKIELTFARVLRSVLRQDPDVILVGEMRDQETVETGLRAALTGHMVLSTLHTNDALTTPIRLLDMGAPRYMVAMSLQLVLAQRLVVNHAPANQVFMALVSGTRYSMLVHPDIKETISINLNDVTLHEALEAIRELYGYEYKIQDTRVYIQPVTLQTRLFQVNYLAGRRVGRADVRVTSGSIQTPSFSAPSQLPGATGTAAPTPAASAAGGAAQSIESSRVTTTTNNDFWAEINDSILSIIGKDGGRSVVVNPTAGVILVRAMPGELRSVDQYLKAMSLVVERQVMLEAKIIEVTLSDQFSTGINWAAFMTGHGRFGAGILTPGATLRTDGSVQGFTARGPDGSLLADSTVTINPAAFARITPDPLSSTVTGSVGSLTSRLAAGANVPASVFGLAFQTSNFATLLTFLESQGTVHVLSSPRIATLNNQKAVIKVGTDEFFVTNVSTTSTSSGTTTTVSPTITTQPFFSGIALDVTPQIADDGQIILHIHPSVSLVTDKTKTLNLGTLGSFTLPLASSNINESDTIVRVQDGTIAAIGGLMKQSQGNNRSGLPNTLDSPILSGIFGSRSQQLNKSELVILLKTTIIKGDAVWQQQAQEVNERMQNLRRPERDKQ